MAIAGIDVGTSGCKVCIYSQTGGLLSQASQKYTEIRGKGIREINPDEVREKILAALEQAAGKCPEKITALAVTCLGESLIFLDENGKVLCNSMVTGDDRGQEGCDSIRSDPGSEYTFRTTGLMPSELYSLSKLIWLRENTDVLQKAKHAFFYEDYVGYLLTGERKVSYSTAARSMALDILNLKWDETLLSKAGLTPDLFSIPVPSGEIIGTVTAEAAKKYHLSTDTVVVAGAHDQVCAALGSGFVGMSLGEDGQGTCECLALMLPKEYDRKLLSTLQMPNMIYPLPNSFFTTLEITTCGALMNWGRDTLFKGTMEDCRRKGIEFFSYMDQKAENLHTDVLILPQFGSSGHPDLRYQVSGSITGLTLYTSEEEIYLALKEAMALQLRLAYEYAEPIGLHFDRIVMTGGAADSELSSRLRANIFKKPVYHLQNREAGTLGCMILAATATGFYPDITTCVDNVVKYSREILPDPASIEEYDEKYRRFKEFYGMMHGF